MAAPTSTRGGTTPQPQWHRAAMEAITTARSRYTADNAMQVVQVMEHLPSLQAEMARLYEHLGQQSVDMVKLPPSTASFFAELGSQMKQQAGALAVGMAAARKSVQEAVDRIRRQDPRETRWGNKENKQGTY